MEKKITREQIKQKLNTKESMILVEALPETYYNAGHLPGAINIPHDKIKECAEEMLPNKDALIVVYCASAECQNSKIAAKTLEQIGYDNVFEYVEGKQHWLETNNSVESSK